MLSLRRVLVKEGWCIELFEVDVIIRTITDMQSVDAAYKLAKSVFVALCSPERNMLQPHDFYPHFADREEAQRAFKLFDQNENGDVSMMRVGRCLRFGCGRD